MSSSGNIPPVDFTPPELSDSAFGGGGAAVEERAIPALAEPAKAADPGPAPPEPPARAAAPRWRAVVREIALLCIIIGGFAATMSTVLSPRVVPLNCDEIDTFFLFIPHQAKSGDAPWKMTDAHSGMYNLTFWLRWKIAGEPTDSNDCAARNRIFNLGVGALLFLALYGFGTWMFDSRFGLILMFTSAFAHMTYFITLEGNYLNETSLTFLLSAWAYLAGEKSNSKWLKFLFGLVCGGFAVVSGMLYFSGRMVVPAILGHGGLMQLQDRKWIRRSAPLLLGISALVAPAAWRFVKDQKSNPELAAFRQRETQILYRVAIDRAMNAYSTDSVAGAVALNMIGSFKAYGPSWNNYHAYQNSLGYVDKISLVLGILGLCWAVLHWRNPMWLMLLVLFFIHNAILGGLTYIPFPPYHQRVHFGILLSHIFIALPLWAVARAPGRWSNFGQFIAGSTMVVMALWNSHMYFARVFDATEHYMKYQGLTQEVADYLVPLSRERDLFVTNCGLITFLDLTSPVFHHGAEGFHQEHSIRRVADFINGAPYYLTRFSPKPPLFCFLRGEGPCSSDDVEKLLPGGRWVKFHEWGQPFMEVYIPPTPKPAPQQPPPGDAPHSPQAP